MIRMAVVYRAALLLVCSNVFMTFAWYAHLRNMADRPWYLAALKLDYLWAALCVMGAVYLVFRAPATP